MNISSATISHDAVTNDLPAKAADPVKAVYAPYTWRRYIHVLLSLAGYFFALFVLSTEPALFTIPGAYFLCMALVAFCTALAFVVSIPIYPSKNRPQSFPEFEIPWSRRSMWKTLAVNAFYDFHNRGTVDSHTLLDYVVMVGTTNVLGIDDTAKYKSAKTLWLGKLKTIALYGFAWYILAVKLEVPYLRSLVDYLFGVQLRLSFITFWDVMLGHLLYPPLGFLGRLRTLAYLLFVTIAGYHMLLLTPFFPVIRGASVGIVDRESKCPTRVQTLLYMQACYEQIALNDPMALYKQQACYSYVYQDLTRKEVADQLLTDADTVAELCDEKTLLFLWTAACVTLGSEIREQPICRSTPDSRIALDCTAKLGIWMGGRRHILNEDEKKGFCRMMDVRFDLEDSLATAAHNYWKAKDMSNKWDAAKHLPRIDPREGKGMSRKLDTPIY